MEKTMGVRSSSLSLNVYQRIREEIQQIAMTAMPRELEEATDANQEGSKDRLKGFLDELIFTCRKIDMAYNDWNDDNH
jgi:predicted translin family RNA/ssDNA-binding protein